MTPPDPPLVPLGVKPTSRVFFATLKSSNSSLGQMTMNHIEKLMRDEEMGPPGGAKGGSGGSKNKVWLKMLKIA